jgi:hypothetical protein
MNLLVNLKVTINLFNGLEINKYYWLNNLILERLTNCLHFQK